MLKVTKISLSEAIRLTLGLPLAAFTATNLYQTAAVAQSASQGKADNSMNFSNVQNNWV